MSGHKIATVTISQEEYRRLYEAERNLSFNLLQEDIFGQVDFFRELASGLQSIHEDAHILSSDSFNHSVRKDDPFSDLNQEIENALSQLHDEIQTNHQWQAAAQKNMNDFIDELVDYTNKKINEAFIASELLRQGNSELSQGCVEMAQNLDEILVYLLTYQKQYPSHESQIEYLTNMKHEAERRMENGNYETAYGLLFQAVQIAQQKLVEIRISESTLNARIATLRQKIKSTKEFLFKNSVFQAIDRDGNLIEAYLNLDEWSNGMYTALLDQVTLLEEDLEILEYKDKNTLQNLEMEVDAVFDTFHEIVVLARTTAINTQIKYEIANAILLALIANGYKPEYGQYQQVGTDECYVASALSPDGSQIRIVVEPDPLHEIGSNVSLISTDIGSKTQYEIKNRADEIRETLITMGYESGSFREVHQDPIIEHQRLRRKLT